MATVWIPELGVIDVAVAACDGDDADEAADDVVVAAVVDETAAAECGLSAMAGDEVAPGKYRSLPYPDGVTEPAEQEDDVMGGRLCS